MPTNSLTRSVSAALIAALVIGVLLFGVAVGALGIDAFVVMRNRILRHL